MDENIARTESRQILADSEALLTEDHFVYASGDHGAGWIAKDLVNVDPRRTARLGELLASAIARSIPVADILCGPVMGGLICGQATALALGLPFVYAERAERGGKPSFELRRNFEAFVKGRTVLVVDDIINTGYSVLETIDVVRAAGGTVAALAAWFNRGNVDAAGLGVEAFVFLDEIALPAWPAQSCPLCAKDVAINTRYAHGAAFVASAGRGA